MQVSYILCIIMFLYNCRVLKVLASYILFIQKFLLLNDEILYHCCFLKTRIEKYEIRLTLCT